MNCWGSDTVSEVKAHQHVEQWMGISTDEISRVKDSRDKWLTNCYPLI